MLLLLLVVVLVGVLKRNGLDKVLLMVAQINLDRRNVRHGRTRGVRKSWKGNVNITVVRAVLLGHGRRTKRGFELRRMTNRVKGMPKERKGRVVPVLDWRTLIVERSCWRWE